MSKYIDADKLMLVLNDWQFLNAPFREEESSIVYDTIGGAMEYVKEQPTADVQEIKRGRWIETTKAVMSNGEFMYTELRTICSLCGKEPLFSYWHNEMQSPYCPWCGAKMDEVEK